MAVSLTPLLLDTCALIFIGEGEALKGDAVARLKAASEAEQLFVSPITAWELGLLHYGRRGRRFLPEPASWFRDLTLALAAKPAPFTPEIAAESSNLPGDFHNDPADRLLVATARAMGAALVTRDRPILAYAATGQVLALAC
jgi:PIN domain nuclease of toxin-antitoxin system